MNQDLIGIVEEYRGKGIPVSDEEADEICKLCYRKMEVAKIQRQEEYLPLLFEDEIKNHLVRKSVNATTMLRMMQKEAV